MLAEGQHLREIVHFGHAQVFPQVSTYTCLLLLTKAAAGKFTFREVSDLNAWSAGDAARSAVLPASSLSSTEWTLAASESEGALLARLRAMPQKLGDVTTRIFQGLKTSADHIFIVDEVERRGRKVRAYSHETETEHWFEPDLLHPLIKGGDSRRYAMADPHRRIIFPYSRIADGSTELIAAEILETDFPLTWQYLVSHRARLEAREDGKFAGENWYAFGRDQALDVISQPKIFTPDLALRAAYCLDETGEKFFTGGVAGGYGILVREEIDRDYVLALLNSRLLDWFVAKNGTSLRGGWHSYEARFIRSAPIFVPEGKRQKTRCGEVAALSGKYRKLASQR